MSDLDSFRKFFRYAAMASTVFSAGLTFWFGIHQHPNGWIAFAVAGFLVVCSVGSDYLILFVREAWRQRNRGMVAFGVVGMATVCTLNLISNLGSVGWQRQTTMNEAKIQNTSAQYARDDVTDTKAQIETWTANLARLEKVSEESSRWSTTATPAGLAAEIANMEGDFLFKRSRQCADVTKPDSRAFCDKLAGLRARVSTITEIESLRKRIDTNVKILSDLREKAKAEKTVVTAPDAQAGFFAGIMTASLTPTETARQWTDKGIAGLIAYGLFLAPIIFAVFGFDGRNRRPDDVLPAATHSAANSGGAHQPASFSPREIVRNVIPGVSVQTVAQLRQIAAA